MQRPDEPRDDDTLTATAALRADHVRTSRLRLLVVGEGVYATYPLPEAGDLIIGRSNKADIYIDNPTISRHHTILHVHNSSPGQCRGKHRGCPTRYQTGQ